MREQRDIIRKFHIRFAKMSTIFLFLKAARAAKPAAVVGKFHRSDLGEMGQHIASLDTRDHGHRLDWFVVLFHAPRRFDADDTGDSAGKGRRGLGSGFFLPVWVYCAQSDPI
jgi:hypothetical protein